MTAKTYVRVEGAEVKEVITPMFYDTAWQPGFPLPAWEVGDEIPIDKRYPSVLIDGTISWMVDVTDLDPQPNQRWVATRDESGAWTFTPPDA